MASSASSASAVSWAASNGEKVSYLRRVRRPPHADALGTTSPGILPPCSPPRPPRCRAARRFSSQIAVRGAPTAHPVPAASPAGHPSNRSAGRSCSPHRAFPCTTEILCPNRTHTPPAPVHFALFQTSTPKHPSRRATYNNPLDNTLRLPRFMLHSMETITYADSNDYRCIHI